MKNIENIAVRGYMTKEVDIRAQILFLIIPIAGYYAWYRINKLRWGFAINLGTSLLIVPLLFMQVTNLFFFATVCYDINGHNTTYMADKIFELT